MFEFFTQISEKLYNRGKTVETNIRAASNSFYDSYLDLTEELLKTIAETTNIELTTRMTCGDILRYNEFKSFLTETLKLDEYTYGKLCDYTLKINAHKHKNEKNVQIETVVNYLRVLHSLVNAFFVYKNIAAVDFETDSVVTAFGITEKENTSLKTEIQKLKEELLSSVESGKLKESDIENYRNLLSQAEIDKLSLEDQNSELQRQISVLKDIKLSSMEEKLNKTIDLLIELTESVIENRAISYAVGDTICGADAFKSYIAKAKKEIGNERK